jgi:L-threonylcarbamoyladenylate synthase
MEEPLRGYLDDSSMEAVAAVLRSGGVAVLPTDTIYGLHCIYSSSAAVSRIRRLKGCTGSHGFILLASSLDMIDGLIEKWPDGTRAILSGLWPAPLTAILPASETVPAPLRPGGAAAVRIPSCGRLLELIRRTGEPLVSTSANRSGEFPLSRIGDIMKEFPALDAYISQRGRGGSTPSTVINLTGEEPRLVRDGRSSRRIASEFGM